MVKVVVFDLDDTIVHSYPDWIRALCNAALTIGARVSKMTVETLRRNRHKDISEIVAAIWPGHDSAPFIAAIDEIAKTVPPLFSGTRGALLTLRDRGFGAALFTARHAADVEPVLAAHALEEQFIFLVSHDSIIHPKPHPEGLQKIVARCWDMGITRDEIVFVGDSMHMDWPCARDAEVRFVATLESGYPRRKELTEAGVPEDHIIGSISELPALIRRW